MATKMTPKQQAKVGKVMREFKEGSLHSGAGKKAPPASAPAPSPYMPSAGTGMPIVDSPQQQQRNQQYQMQTRAALTPAVSPERQRIMDMLNAEAAGAQARAAFQQRQKAFATPAPRRRMAKGGVVAKMSTAKGKKK